MTAGSVAPYSLRRPREVMASDGRTAARKASEREVELPWWPAMSTGARGRSP